MPTFSTHDCNRQFKPGILFQFILYDFFLVNSENKALTRKKDIASIQNVLSRLTGSDSDGLHNFRTWMGKNGSLWKLKSHCDRLLAQAGIEAPQYSDCQKKADSCLIEANSALRFFWNKETTQEGIQCLQGFKAKMHELKKSLKNTIPIFRWDENVVYFMLRNNGSFNEHFGQGFVRKRITRMYPGGIQEAEQFLVERYMARGFDSHLPIIQAKIKQTE